MAITATIGAGVIGAGGAILAGGEQANASKKASATSAQATNEATATQLAMYNQTRSDLNPFIQMGTSALPALASFLSPQGPVNSNLSRLSDLYGQSGPISSLLGLGPNGAAGMNDQLKQFPGYQFAMDQGRQAVDRSAASRGLNLSGGTLKELTGYGQGMASQLYDKYLGDLTGFGTGLSGVASQYGTYGNEIAGLVNVGGNAAAGVGNAGSAAGSSIGNALIQGANQQSSALQNAGTASASGIAGAANQIGGLLNNQSLLAQFNNPEGSYPAVAVGPTQDGGFTYSDRRLKTDAHKVGELKSGLSVYSYRMKGSSHTQLGVMADEVEKRAPKAVKKDRAGYRMVDYGKVSRLPALKEAA